LSRRLRYSPISSAIACLWVAAYPECSGGGLQEDAGVPPRLILRSVWCYRCRAMMRCDAEEKPFSMRLAISGARYAYNAPLTLQSRCSFFSGVERACSQENAAWQAQPSDARGSPRGAGGFRESSAQVARPAGAAISGSGVCASPGVLPPQRRGRGRRERESDAMPLFMSSGLCAISVRRPAMGVVQKKSRFSARPQFASGRPFFFSMVALEVVVAPPAE